MVAGEEVDSLAASNSESPQTPNSRGTPVKQNLMAKPLLFAKYLYPFYILFSSGSTHEVSPAFWCFLPLERISNRLISANSDPDSSKLHVDPEYNLVTWTNLVVYSLLSRVE